MMVRPRVSEIDEAEAERPASVTCLLTCTYLYLTLAVVGRLAEEGHSLADDSTNDRVGSRWL